MKEIMNRKIKIINRNLEKYIYQIGGVFKKPCVPSFRDEFTSINTRHFNLLNTNPNQLNSIKINMRILQLISSQLNHSIPLGGRG